MRTGPDLAGRRSFQSEHAVGVVLTERKILNAPAVEPCQSVIRAKPHHAIWGLGDRANAVGRQAVEDRYRTPLMKILRAGQRSWRRCACWCRRRGRGWRGVG